VKTIVSFVIEIDFLRKYEAWMKRAGYGNRERAEAIRAAMKQQMKEA